MNIILVSSLFYCINIYMDIKSNHKAIAIALRKLRRERGLTQAELAQVLGLSQPHFSKIERGQGSLSAEQLIALLHRFSLPVSYFSAAHQTVPEESSLQNALAHLGARHLREVSGVAVPERLSDPEAAIAETLITAPDARLVTALAPVLVQNYENVNFARLAERLSQRGVENRLWWLVEGTYRSLEERLEEPYLSRDIHRLYQKAFLLLARKKQDYSSIKFSATLDELDRDLLSELTVTLVRERRDVLADHWNLITRITQEDFLRALQEAEL